MTICFKTNYFNASKSLKTKTLIKQAAFYTINKEKHLFLLKRGVFYHYKKVFAIHKAFKNMGFLNRSGNPIWYHSKYFYIGLGYKMYTRKGSLYVWVGLTHYTILKYPPSVFVFAKKKRIYIMSKRRDDFQNFLFSIRSIKKRDIYKGKGLLEVKSYKNFIRMKTGKKKQY